MSWFWQGFASAGWFDNSTSGRRAGDSFRRAHYCGFCRMILDIGTISDSIFLERILYGNTTYRHNDLGGS